MEFPAKEFYEINRVLFLASGECKTEEQTSACQKANEAVAAAAEKIKEFFEILNS